MVFSSKVSLLVDDLDTFGGIAWSMDETKIAYIAEKLGPKEGSAKYAHRPDWGEGYTDKIHPTLFVLELASKEIKMIEYQDIVGEVIIFFI